MGFFPFLVSAGLMDSSLYGVEAACLPLGHDMMAMACCLHLVFLSDEILPLLGIHSLAKKARPFQV